MAMGDLLADEVQRVLNENELSVDVVIPVSMRPLSCCRNISNSFLQGTGHIASRSAEFGTKVVIAVS